MLDALPSPVHVVRPSRRPTGAKLALKPLHVWGIRIRLQVAAKCRDLALFDLALDSKLRGCDLVALRVGDIVSASGVRSRVMILQRKTGRPVQRACQLLLGHTKLEGTVRYLGVEVDDALALSESLEL